MNAFEQLVELDGGMPMYFDDPEWESTEDPWGLDEQEETGPISGSLKTLGKIAGVCGLITAIFGVYRGWPEIKSVFAPVECELSLEEYQAAIARGESHAGEWVEWVVEMYAKDDTYCKFLYSDGQFGFLIRNGRFVSRIPDQTGMYAIRARIVHLGGDAFTLEDATAIRLPQAERLKPVVIQEWGEHNNVIEFRVQTD